MNEKIYKETYHDLKKSGTTKISYGQYRDRLHQRNQAQKKKAYEERKVRMA